MQGLQEQNGHVSRPARMRLWRYSMEHTGGTTEVPNYFYQISDAGTVKNAILWGNQIISSWSFIFAGSLAFTQSWAMSWRNRRRPRKTINWWPQTPPGCWNGTSGRWTDIKFQSKELALSPKDIFLFLRVWISWVLFCLSQGAEPCKKWRATGHCLGIGRIHQLKSPESDPRGQTNLRQTANDLYTGLAQLVIRVRILNCFCVWQQWPRFFDSLENGQTNDFSPFLYVL